MGKIEKSIIDAEKYCEDSKVDFRDKIIHLLISYEENIKKDITCSLGDMDEELVSKFDDRLHNLHVDLTNIFIRKAEEIKDKILDISDNVDGISDTKTITTWADVFNPRERRIPKDE